LIKYIVKKNLHIPGIIFSQLTLADPEGSAGVAPLFEERERERERERVYTIYNTRQTIKLYDYMTALREQNAKIFEQLT
jgi:hypothetical protein